MKPGIRLLLTLALGFAPGLPARIVGTNAPARPLTAARIRQLSVADQPVWREYLARSEHQWQADQTAFQQELRQPGRARPIIPPEAKSAASIPMGKPAAWYSQPEARRIADIVVSFQTPAGGWSKNLDLTAHPRALGERFAHDNGPAYQGKFENGIPRDRNWSYVGTFDNDATITELRYLAKVIAAADPETGGPYRAAFLRGLDYVFAAQYPNGGWPQVWPLEGGYHDAITYNDGAMIHVVALLGEIAAGKAEFAFVPAPARTRAKASFTKALDCILKTQIVAAGRRTVWCQQHDPLTLEPASARNYEMPAQASAESAGIVTFLMELPDPSPAVGAAIRSAAEWFAKTEIRDVAFQREGNEPRRLVAAPGRGPLWARYYETGWDRPLFGDRNKLIYDRVEEISAERRDGYAWYTDAPRKVRERFALWQQTHP